MAIPLKGFVSGANGAPRAGVTVTLKVATNTNPNGNAVTATTTTDASGMWAFSAPDGAQYDVFIEDGAQVYPIKGNSIIPHSFTNAQIGTSADIALTKLNQGTLDDTVDPDVVTPTTLQARLSQIVAQFKTLTGLAAWTTNPGTTVGGGKIVATGGSLTLEPTLANQQVLVDKGQFAVATTQDAGWAATITNASASGYGLQCKAVDANPALEVVNDDGINAEHRLYGSGEAKLAIASGNVSIGNGTATDKLQIFGGGIVLDNNQGVRIKDTLGTGRNAVWHDAANNALHDNGGGTHSFRVAGAEKVQISAAGNLGVGVTPGYPLDVEKAQAAGQVARFINTDNSTTYGVLIGVGNASGGTALDIRYGVAPNTLVSSFTHDGTSLTISNCTVTAPCDERLKHAIHPTRYGLATVQALRPVDFCWNRDGAADVGLVAQELARVLPEAVRPPGPGGPDVWGLNLVPLLAVTLRAVQELGARVEALEAACGGTGKAS